MTEKFSADAPYAPLLFYYAIWYVCALCGAY